MQCKGKYYFWVVIEIIELRGSKGNFVILLVIFAQSHSITADNKPVSVIVVYNQIKFCH